MKSKTLIIVAGVTLVLIVLAISLVDEKKQAQVEENVSGQPFLPHLMKDINAAATVELTQRGKTITLERNNDIWSVKESGDYPADFTKLRQTLIALSDLKTVEAKTRKADNYQRLGVQDPDANNDAKQVIVKDGNGAELASFIVGNSRP